MRIPRPTTLTVLSGVLLVLLPALALLQYRWVGQLSVAERERMQRNLRSAAQQFRAAFDVEVARAALNLQVGPITLRDGASEQYSDRYDNWLDTAEHPQLVADIYAVDDADNALRVRRWDAGQQAFVSLPWPAVLEPWRAAFEQERQSFGVERSSERRRPFVDDDALLVTPIRRGFRPLGQGGGAGPPTPSVFGFTVLRLDMEYARTVLLPSLAQRHFTHSQGNSYRVTVVASDASHRLIYRSDDAAPLDVAAADASELLYGPFFTRGPLGRMLAGREAPGANAAEPREPGVADASTDGFGLTSSAPTNDAGERGIGIPSRREALPSRWRLLLQHERGSLDQAVAEVRRRNLAISFGALLLLGGSIGLLTESSRRAQRLARQQMEFVAGVSHELRTPVAVIKSAAENLAHGVIAGERVKQYGKVIGVEAQRLGDMVEQVLHYAAVESGAAFAAQAPTHPSTIISAAVDSATATQGEGVVVERFVDADIPLVRGDVAGLRSAVQNLIANAVKYGGPDRWVGIRATRHAARAGDAVRIEVTDHGRGIPASEVALIFEPFYRGSDAVAKQIHGNGLGLSLVRRIVTAHGGRVGVASAPGMTTFTIVLPGVQPHPHAEALAREAGVAARS